MMMEHRQAEEPSDRATVEIDAARGWQSSGWELQAGRSYRVTASGRFEIAREQPDEGDEITWPCEPGGVTIRYHEGRPLGMLLGAWHETASGRFSGPFAVGLSSVIKPPADAVLYLRVNDSAARLSDNRGTLAASIRRVAD